MTFAPIAILPLPKPALGQACNGCGYCCTVQPCRLAEELLNCHVGPCIALEHEDGRTYCGLVRRPLVHLFKAQRPDITLTPEEANAPSPVGDEIATDVAKALGVGRGCDADDPF